MTETLLLRMRQHQLLTQLRNSLVHLHRILLETEQIAYEQVRGRVSKGELLQLVIHHDQFAWLHRLSELIVQIDDLLRADEPVLPDTIATLVADVRTLLTPFGVDSEFAEKYDAALQRHPDVVLAHAQVLSLLASRSM